MSHEVKIHEVQTLILRELLFRPEAGYADLQRPTGLTSDHFNFHINRLMDLGFVERLDRGVYRLSIAGKEYANKLDTDSNSIERQPKVAVMLAITKEVDGVRTYVIQKRIKNPNYGFYGFPTGKVRWGETILDTARRECMEETGLEADFEVAGVYHEHVRLSESGRFMEDKVFFICRAKAIKGELQKTFEGGENQWLTIDKFRQKDKKFSSIDDELRIMESNEDEWLIEKTTEYQDSSF